MDQNVKQIITVTVRATGEKTYIALPMHIRAINVDARFDNHLAHELIFPKGFSLVF